MKIYNVTVNKDTVSTFDTYKEAYVARSILCILMPTSKIKVEESIKPERSTDL